jgi:hypothetical protein
MVYEMGHPSRSLSTVRSTTRRSTAFATTNPVGTTPERAGQGYSNRERGPEETPGTASARATGEGGRRTHRIASPGRVTDGFHAGPGSSRW